MNAFNAISSNELDNAEWVPTYYCETCGKELHHPPATGNCDDCDEQRESLLTTDLALTSDL